MTDHGHRDRWTPPSTGWPTFDPDGRRVRDADEATGDDGDPECSS